MESARNGNRGIVRIFTGVGKFSEWEMEGKENAVDRKCNEWKECSVIGMKNTHSSADELVT